jgi:phosphoglycolate phosphatase-like HAD superfamily hydrolase
MTPTLVLFDIDGTLVLTGGAGRRALERAFAEVTGRAASLDGIPFAGRTDRRIVADLLERAGALGRLGDEPWLARLRETYCRFLEEELAAEDGPGRLVLPGVRELLDALAARGDTVAALLTGNFEDGARIKLSHFGLWRYFPWGAFGDAAEDRNALLPVALDLARARGLAVSPDRTFIVGDTPLDVACARAGGVRAVAVATGGFDAAVLEAAGADVVFEDLGNTGAVLEWLWGPTGARG